MEDRLIVGVEGYNRKFRSSLNPCFNGRQTDSLENTIIVKNTEGS